MPNRSSILRRLQAAVDEALRKSVTEPGELDLPDLEAQAQDGPSGESRAGESRVEDQRQDPPAPPCPRRGRVRQTPAEALGRAALDAALTPSVRRRLRRSAGLAIVCRVPSSSWGVAIEHALVDRHLRTAARVFRRDAGTRPATMAGDAEAVAEALAAGTPVLGLSSAPERYLPPVLHAAADIRLHIAAPTAAVIAAAMRRCLRGRVPPLESDIASGLDWEAILSCLRVGQPAASAVARLRAASAHARREDAGAALPSLDEAIVYGPAREWGLALARDIADWRAGRLPLADIHGDALLFGPPGTGKTWLLRILARACGLPLVLTSVADWFASGSGHLDAVVRQQREAFSRAASAAPCILGLDELDALPSRTGITQSENRDYWTPIINDFLSQIDGAVGRPPGVIVVGITNHPEAIDPALLRPGRLERRIEIPVPDASGLAWVLRWHLGSDLPGADLAAMAGMVRGATPADAMGWVRSARRRARQQDRALAVEDLLDQMAPPDRRTHAEIWRAAVHEAGHVVVHLAFGTGRLRAVSIVARSGNGGQTTIEGLATSVPDRAQIERWVVPLLAGRAAEAALCGSVSTGAGGSADSDLARATRSLASVHAHYGLGDRLTCLGPEPDLAEPAIAAAVEADLRRLQAEADLLVLQHRAAIERLARTLVARRFVDGPTAADIAGFGSTVPAQDSQDSNGNSRRSSGSTARPPEAPAESFAETPQAVGEKHPPVTPRRPPARRRTRCP